MSSIFILTASILAATLFFNVVLLIITITENRYRKTINQIFATHLLCIAGWAASLLLLLLFAATNDFPTFIAGDTGYSIAKIVFLWATALFATNYWFVDFFIHNTLRVSKLNIFIGGLQIIALGLCLLDNTLYTEFSVQSPGFITVAPGPLEGIYSIFLLAHLTVPLFLLWRYGRKESSEQKRSQYHILFPYYLLFLIASMTFNWILPVYLEIFTFNALGPTTSLILVVGITYAITRYGFLDIRVIIQRGLIYSTLFGFIVLLYTGILHLSSQLFTPVHFIDDFVTGLVTTILGIITVPRLDQYLRHQTDRWFFKGRYNYNEVLHVISQTLQSSLDLDTLLHTCEQLLANTLRATSIKIVPHKTSMLTTEEGYFTVPIRLQDKLRGLIVVGPKRSGEVYSVEDKDLLETFATQAATAMSRIFLYQEVKRRADELEVKVAERTQELQTAQEKQRTMMLHISHNLQTPLAILQTKIEHLKKSSQSEEVLNLERSLDHTSQFIADLLKLARLESGHEDLMIEAINLSSFLQEIADEVSIIADDDNITVATCIEENISVSTDLKRLREAIMNLLSNAVKYIGDKNPKNITITLSQTTDSNIITIKDTGIGIPTGDLANIFSDFNRGKNQTRASGTGLGLSITQETINLLGGTISVESEVGRGTTFVITLPR